MQAQTKSTTVMSKSVYNGVMMTSAVLLTSSWHALDMSWIAAVAMTAARIIVTTGSNLPLPVGKR